MDSLVERLTLNECPPGLFLFNGRVLGFKSEYTTTLENPRRYQCDAYVVASGEYFHGGAKSSHERGELIVQPIAADELTRITAENARLRGLIEPTEANVERVARAIDAANPVVPAIGSYSWKRSRVLATAALNELDRI